MNFQATGILAHIVRLEQRQLSPATILVLQVPEQVLLQKLDWSPTKRSRVQSELAEMLELHRLGNSRLHCLASRRALLNLLHDEVQEIGLDVEVNKLHSGKAVDDMLFGLSGDLALIARLYWLQHEYEQIQKEKKEPAEVKP